MTFLFQIILLVSFIGLVVIVARNRLSNPQMRIQFLEDLEMNKRRLHGSGRWLKEFAKSTAILISHYVRVLLSQLERGASFLVSKIRIGIASITSKIASQAKELRQDMKSFEVPHHKKDFLERLEGRPEEKEEPSARRSLGERFLGHAQETISSTPSKEVSTVSQEREEELPLLKERPAQGFQESELKGESVAVEVEIDKDILMKKEKWLLYAIAKNPRNANFYKKLGRIYLQLNNRDDARNCFEYAVRLGSQDPEIRALLGQLKHGI